MEKEVSPLPGQLISLADVDRRLNELEVQFNTLLEQAAEQTDGLDCMERFQAINEEIAALKQQRTQIESICKNSNATAQRMNRVASILESASPTLSQWDEAVIRQLLDTVKVISAEKIIVYLRGGMEIEQDITK